MISLRLEKNLEKTVTNIAKSIGITKSDLIRRSVRSFLSNCEKNNAWILGKDLFGKYGSDNRKLSIESENILRKKIKKKN